MNPDVVVAFVFGFAVGVLVIGTFVFWMLQKEHKARIEKAFKTLDEFCQRDETSQSDCNPMRPYYESPQTGEARDARDVYGPRGFGDLP